jgi:hypothetical protein
MLHNSSSKWRQEFERNPRLFMLRKICERIFNKNLQATPAQQVQQVVLSEQTYFSLLQDKKNGDSQLLVAAKQFFSEPHDQNIGF